MLLIHILLSLWYINILQLFALKTQKAAVLYDGSCILLWQRPTFPGSYPPSIISAEELNYRVRNGNGWDLFAIITRDELFDYKLNNAENVFGYRLTHITLSKH